MRRAFLLAALWIVLTDGVGAQVFGFRRPNVWYVQPQPSLGFYLGHSGMDLAAEKTVSDVFCWGAGLDLRFGANFRRLSFNNNLKMRYVESHTTGQIPIKGPSVFEFATRPTYNLLRDTSSAVGVAFQGGWNTALTQETDGGGRTTRKFFDPASIYEGLFISGDAAFGSQRELQVSVQLGYSLQQLKYRSPSDGSGDGSGGQAKENWSGGGSTAFLSVAYNQREVLSENPQRVIVFFADMTLKGFRKEPGFSDIKNSRVEASMRVGLNVLEYIDFLTSAEVIYDSNVSPRRELRTSVSVNFKYNIDLAGGL
jgi:hypothetical protein